MKGRLTKIVEGRAILIAHLRSKFDKHLHLIDEFLREHSLDNQNEKWGKLSKTEIERLFERYITPCAANGLSGVQPQLDELRMLSTIRRRIESIENELQAGASKISLQQLLKGGVLQPLVELNQNWMRDLKN